jgi:hypothetical protein
MNLLPGSMYYGRKNNIIDCEYRIPVPGYLLHNLLWNQCDTHVQPVPPGE